MNLPNRECANCGITFRPRDHKHKYCKKACVDAARRKRDYIPRAESITDKQALGALSELSACSDLLLRGYYVFRNVAGAGPCDLIAMKGDDLTRVEVRSGYLKNDGTMVYPKTPPHYTYDVLAVVLRDNRIVYVDRHGSEWSP